MKQMIDLAINEARRSTNMFYNHGCVIFSGGKPIVADHNTHDICGHAETRALMQLCKEKSCKQGNESEI
jgi:pyrimidine deaminase RibD-like protein